MSMEAGMLYIINGDTFYLFMMNTWIRDSEVSCHITNNDAGLFDIIDINKLIKGSSKNMSAKKKGKLCFSIQQVDGTEWDHTLLPVKCCYKAGANLYS